MNARTGYDSATPSAIPAAARLVFPYIDGRFAWPADQLARFKDAVKVTITVTGHPVADIADCETGDLTIPGAVEWIRSRGGHKATVYIERSKIAELQAAARGLHYSIWAADWTGQPHEVPGAALVQYADPAHGSGGDYDVSVVHDPTWYPEPVHWKTTALHHAQQLEATAATLAHQAAALRALIGDHQ